MDIRALLNSPEAAELDGAGEDAWEDAAAVSYADGYIAAVIVSPRSIDPGEWMPQLIDTASGELNADQAEIARQLMLIEYRRILDSLAARDGGYEPYFWEDGNGRLVTSNWAEGFLAGMELGGAAWDRILGGDEDLTGLVPLFILLQDEEILATVAEEGGLGPEESLLLAQAELPLLIQDFFEASPHGSGFGLLSKKVGRTTPAHAAQARNTRNAA